MLTLSSLQATWIRNTIARALRESTTVGGTKVVPENVVYANPTISRLAEFCARFDTLEVVGTDGQEEKRQAMLAFVDKYTKNIPSFATVPCADPLAGGAVILVTGTTGGLGSHLLQTLASSTSVAKVYALNRPSSNGQPLVERQRLSLVERGLDEAILGSSKLELLEADLEEESLGLGHELLQEVIFAS
jgi:hypothetical protein